VRGGADRRAGAADLHGAFLLPARDGCPGPVGGSSATRPFRSHTFLTFTGAAVGRLGAPVNQGAS